MSRLKLYIAIAAAAFFSLRGLTLAQFPPIVIESDLDGAAGFVVHGILTFEFGQTVAGIGDVNADGIDDFASGGTGIFPQFPCALLPCECVGTPGAVYVLFGRPDIGAAGEWNLDQLDNAGGIRIEGYRPFGNAGYVSPAGDFNNDGIDDFLIGAPLVSGVFVTSGEAYMVYGAPGLGVDVPVDLSTLFGSDGFRIYGAFGNAFIGSRMGPLGDFNGDGIDDIVFGVPGPSFETTAGQVYIIYGKAGSPPAVPFALPHSMTPKFGLKIYGIASGDGLGAAVASAGDVNGDGFMDLVTLGAHVEPFPLAEGQAYVIYGGPDIGGEDGVFDLNDLDACSGFAINGPPSEIAGYDTKLGRVAGVGDINGDGYDDIAVAVIPSAIDDSVLVIFGGPNVAPDGVISFDDIDGSNGFVLLNAGNTPDPDPAGDMNHDGIDDMSVNGLIIFGEPGIGASGVVDFDDIQDGQHASWFAIPLGTRGMGSVGDVNNDGIDDFARGGRYWIGEGLNTCEVGRVGVLFGRRMGDGDLDADIDLADFGQFQVCFGQPPDGDVPDQCHPFDFDKDNDIDLNDCAEFETLFGTPP